MNRRCTRSSSIPDPTTPATLVVAVQPPTSHEPPPSPPPVEDNKTAIYNRAYSAYRRLLAAGVVDESSRRDVMVMLVAPRVDFDRHRTRLCSRQPRSIVHRVFDNMESNGLWKNGKWLFQHGDHPESKEDRKCQMVEFALHVLCAAGEATCIMDEPQEPVAHGEAGDKE